MVAGVDPDADIIVGAVFDDALKDIRKLNGLPA
jgi:hypothetical protein